MPDVSPDWPVLLFDGECGLCDRSVQFVLRHDRSLRFRFAALQSAPGQDLLRRHGLNSSRLNTVVLIAGGRACVRSTAALETLRLLGAPWSWFAIFRLIPGFLRDGVYNFVARRRHRLRKPQGGCRLLTPAERLRFLDT